MRRRLLDHTYNKTATGNPAVARSVARMYPDISFPGFTTQDREPSPENPVDIVNAQSPVQVEVMGANLFPDFIEDTVYPNGSTVKINPDGSITVHKVAGDAANINKKVYLKKGVYTLSNGLTSGNPIYIQVDNTATASSGSIIVNIPSSGEYKIYLYSNANYSGDVTIYPMLNIGETPLPYEKYKQPQTVTITSDRPITKWDKLVKQNGVWGWLYKSNEVEIDGSVDENIVAFPRDNASVYTFNLVSLPKNIGQTNLICDKFFVVNKAWQSNEPHVISGHNNYPYVYFNVDKDDIADSSAGSVREWLQLNPIKVLYETENTEFVPLPQEQQDQLNALHTNNPTTIVQNSIGTDVTLTYKTKRSLEVTQ